jgi:hypothetical protein
MSLGNKLGLDDGDTLGFTFGSRLGKEVGFDVGLTHSL